MKWLKIILAIALLLCLAPMPYGYYMVIRFAVMIAFAIMAYNYAKEQQIALCIVSIAIIIAFQPVVKIPFGRTVWNILDTVIAICLIITLLLDNKKIKE